MRRVISLILGFSFSLGCHAPVQQPSVKLVSTTDSAKIMDVRFPSSSIDGLLWYRAIVPNPEPGEQLPVMYLLHGANSDPAEIIDRSDVTKLASAAHLIVVMPYADYSYYTNARHRRHARWEDAIVVDLPRDVETRLPVLTGRDHTGIAGVSMGGYGALKLSLKHPELYGFAASLSGALDITRRPVSLSRWGQTWTIRMIFGMRPSSRLEEDVFQLLHDPPPAARTVKWFESCGQTDPLYIVNERFAREARKRGMTLISITTPGGHDWQSWNTVFPKLFETAARNLH